MSIKEDSSTGYNHKGEVDSPFLNEKLSVGETEEELDPRAVALAAESPFQTAFEQGRMILIEPEEGEVLAGVDEASFGELASVVPKRSPLRMPEALEELADAEDDVEWIDELELPSFEFDTPSAEIEAALSRSAWSEALALAIAGGERDESKLTNLLFFARHADLDQTRKLDPEGSKADKELAGEWIKIRDREVWAAIVKSAENSVLAVKGKEVASEHRTFWSARGKSFKQLVKWAAKEVDLDPGLLATALLAETGSVSSYLKKSKVSSYHVGVDDFFALRSTLAKNVPAYSKIGWDKKQKPVKHLNDAKTKQREVQTIYFDSGRDALLATCVYLNYGEVRLRDDAKAAGGDFDALPLETRFALIRMSMAAGRAGADKRLQRALKGEDILVRNWKPAKIYQTERNATIRAAQALHISDWIFGNKPPALTQPELAYEYEYDESEADDAELDDAQHAHAYESSSEDEADEFESSAFDGENDDEALDEGELDFEHLRIFDFQVAGGSSSPTLGFEFDLNFGFEREVVDTKGLTPPAGFEWPSEGLKATDHESDDGKGGLADGFIVTMDAVRMEIGTAPFHIDDDAAFDMVVDGVVKFGKELVAAKKTHQSSLDVPGIAGHPTTFEHSRTVVNKPDVDASGQVEFPGDRKHASYQRARLPLVIHRLYNKYPTKTGLWASPQATVTLPLAEFGKLVWEIHRTKGGSPGKAFTGRKTDRLGLRDDLAWLALTRAVADRKKKLGTSLSDGSTVSDADFSRSVTAIVTILLMYLLTSIEYDAEDKKKESYAKGSLPLNVKTPLWQIHRFALTDREKFVLHELYTDSGKRDQLFSLASGTSGGNGERLLFPTYTHWDAKRFLGSEPTWRRLVDALVKEERVLVTETNSVPKKGHRKGDEILIAPLSSKLDWDKTKPRIAVEMRRLGFDPVGFSKWPGLMKRLRALAIKVNP